MVSGVMMCISLSACSGIFGEIYDSPQSDENSEFGFIEVDEKAGTGRIYIDATDYTEWHYIDLSDKKVVTVSVDGQAPTHWDFAVHRYDTKTHGGKVMQTDYTDFSAVPSVSQLPDAYFIPDEWTTEVIRVDMSQMMDGVIVYAEDYYNPCLSAWLKVDTSSMPPDYTLSGKIYLLQLSDGSYAALRLANYMNDATVKGYMTIDYLYPFQL